ncbi:family 20 glycosylhydrolase [Cellulomonas endophytica]|uniref:family 20 glycosylhydrolase n=1 Tax=Cellulomonas endophytica TaxID=2494735 RepID=UPI00196A6CDD|nr:family 20 glycosylhydrolase [Cellulomonas endophytica]
MAAPPTPLPLVPAPVRAVPGPPGAVVRLGAAPDVDADPGAELAAAHLRRVLAGTTGGTRTGARTGAPGAADADPVRVRPAPVRLRLDGPPPAGGVPGTPVPGTPVPGGPVAGAYRLTVAAPADGTGPGHVEVRAEDAAGLLHGVVTLAALLRPAANGWEVDPVTVEDAPRFGWRGLSLDVARSFLAPEDVRRVVDLLVELKLNVLHLHLTDDQGWRLEVPSRPALVERSSGTAVDGGRPGAYTVAEYADLVAYAGERGVVVVPEIDLPGHVNAALHAYGELSPDGERTQEYTGIDVGFSRLRPDLPATEPFLVDVLGDVAAQTPGPFVHIGGDEVHEAPAEEYAAVVAVAAREVRRAGRTPVAWQEAAGTDLGPGAVLQLWDVRLDPTTLLRAAADGAHVVLSPAPRVYLDMKYDERTELGLYWAGYVELRDSYDWEPLDLVAGLPADRVLGVEAALWSETVRSLDDVMHLLLPRLAAVAEVAWSAAEVRGWDGFVARVGALSRRWDADGRRWYRSPQGVWPAPPGDGHARPETRVTRRGEREDRSVV